MDYPEYVKVDGVKYKINTDFRNVLKCQEIAKSDVSDLEKVLGIILTLYGEEGYNCPNIDKLLDVTFKFFNCGKEETENNKSIQNVSDMDYKQDFGLIVASFKSQYGIDITEEKLHWWKFFDYLNGLNEDCVLNRVREIRTCNLNDITDLAEREKIRKAKEYYKLKEEPAELTEQQRESVATFYELTGLKRKGE